MGNKILEDKQKCVISMNYLNREEIKEFEIGINKI
jgi:hypothetical protein